MERVGAWLWRSHRRRFVVGVSVVSILFVLFTILVPAVTVGSLYLHLGRGEALMWGVGVGGVILLLLPAVILPMSGTLEPIQRWIDGDRSDPAETWAALLRLPQESTRRAATTVLPIVAVTTYPWVLTMAETNVQGTAALAIAYVLVSLTTLLLFATVGQLVLGPAVADVGMDLGAVTAIDRGTRSIHRRLVLVSFATTALTGAAMPAAVLGTSADGNDYLVALAGGAMWAAYLGVVFDLGVLRPTLRPLGEVAAATERVRRGDVSTPVPVSSPDELGDLAAAFNEMQQGLAERESLQAAFGSYVDPGLAQRLLESGSSVFEGEDVVVSVLFADVRDFTSYAERVQPAVAVDRLNRLFDIIVPVVHVHGGHTNHYLGDGLLAVFGAPQPLDHHADGAVAAAVEMQRRVRDQLGTEMRIGIGINTGRVIAGTVGGGGRLEFTVIGDTVNVAARVEQLTKDTGDSILITEATRVALSVPRPRTTRRGEVDLKGKSAKVTVHAVNPFPRSTR